MTTPAWSAAQNGLPGNLDATNASAQVNQFLGTHGLTAIYDGTQVLTPGGNGNFVWVTYGDGEDLDQPFVLSGTTVARVTLPVAPFGVGADMMVSLYADSAGSPNVAAGALASTMVPAAVIGQLAAPNGLTAGGPLATAGSNSAYLTGGVTNSPWAPPAVDAGGASTTSSYATSGNYIIGLGGNSLIAPGNAYAGVTTTQYLGGGVVALPVPQPPLPIATSIMAVAVTDNAIVVMGGSTGIVGSLAVTNVWVASWDSNAGIIGSWSAQTPLPVASMFASGVAYGSTVYYIGGSDVSLVPKNTVYYNTVNNGQLGPWAAAAPYPTPIYSPFVAAVNGWLIVMGGIVDDVSTVTSAVYYAQIKADGSLGPWQAGPSLAAPNSAFGPGFDTAVGDDLIAIIGGVGTSGSAQSTVQVLSVTASGPSNSWVVSNWSGTRFFPVSAFGTGNGNYDVVAINFNASPVRTEYSRMVSVPLLSVPLNATGLTNGNTYHVVVQQRQVGTSVDYLAWGLLDSGLPSAAKNSARHSGSWSTITGYAIPMTVYNNSGGVNARHLVEDANSYGVNQKWSTLLYNNVGLLTGHLESTLFPNNPLNSNPTFTSGVSPWTATGGTITQSSTQTHGGFALSGLLTPNGVAGTAFVNSEFLPVQQGGGPFYGASQWYLLDGWYYSPTGYASFSPSINWYDRNQGFLSTNNHTTTLPAATWTHVQAFYEAPATAAYAKINVLESGTPTSSNTVFLSDVYLIQSPECVGSFTSAATVNYPSGQLWPPTGVTQLL